MADIANLKAFAEGLTEDEKYFLAQAEFVKLRQFLGGMSVEQFLGVQAVLNAQPNYEAAPEQLKVSLVSIAQVPFADPSHVENVEKILELKKKAAA